jgi:predicted DCC family thiol-disulfide oxidoreductase YuxK
VERTIVLFDGVCNLCNGFVNFLIDRDPEGRLAFGALQTEGARKLMREAGLPDQALESVVAIEAGRGYVRSTAALRILLRLGGVWALLGRLALVVPRPLRDLVYDAVAERRYLWFGTRDTCRVPTPELEARFLDPLPGSQRARTPPLPPITSNLNS